MNLSSPFGSFKMSYSDHLNGSSNAQGGAEKGAAQATFNSPKFGDLFNFSATEMMGSGGMRGGLSAGADGSNGASSSSMFTTSPMGAESGKRPTTSLNLRMSF
jgi:hypothetical protein